MRKGKYRSKNQIAKPSVGLGDIIKTGLSKIGIKPCSGCEKRRVMLNKFGEKVVNIVTGKKCQQS